MLSIKLKNIDLEGVTLSDEIKKVEEEDREFESAVLCSTKKHQIEEFWDCMQARLGVLQLLGIGEDEVMEGYRKHLKKIKNRPRVKKV